MTSNEVQENTTDNFPRMIPYTEDALAVQEPHEKDSREDPIALMEKTQSEF